MPTKFVVYSPHNPGPVLSEHPDLDWSERRALTYFQDRTAFELAGAFEPDFWMKIILPLARQESSVRHAIVALSSMHEHYSGVDHFSPTRGVDFALHHYGRAMREVVQFNQANPDRTLEHALVTCALFSTFESLQGQYHEACSHAISGIRMLAEEQRSLGNSPITPRIPREPLARFFIASHRQIQELGDPNFPGQKPELFYTKTEISLPEQFTSHEQALLHMEILLRGLIQYAIHTGNLEPEDALSEDVILSLTTEFHSFKILFDKWKAAFDAFSSSESNEFAGETPESLASSNSSAPSSPDPRDQPQRSARNPAYLILRIYYSLVTPFLARIERNDETVFDEYLPDFWTAVDAAEEFINCTSTYVKPEENNDYSQLPFSEPSQQQPSQVARPTFSLALGVVPTLFLIATRITHPPLRDKARSLLRTCNRREGLWDSNLSCKLVDRILELQEAARQMARDQRLDVQFDMDMNTGTTRTTVVNSSSGDVDIMTDSSFTTPAAPTAGPTLSPDDPKEVVFKLMDISFLPDRKCVMRYTFLRSDSLVSIDRLRDTAASASFLAASVGGGAANATTLPFRTAKPTTATLTIPSISEEQHMLPPGTVRQNGVWEEVTSWEG